MNNTQTITPALTAPMASLAPTLRSPLFPPDAYRGWANTPCPALPFSGLGVGFEAVCLASSIPSLPLWVEAHPQENVAGPGVLGQLL